MIRSAALGLVTAIILTGAVHAQEMSGSPIESVIRDQIADFQQDDWSAAFEHASPAIRRIFGSADNFGRMVRDGYPMVWRPSELRFGEIRGQGDIALQPVIVFDAQGVPHALEYEMIRLESGWKINGVRRLQAATGA